MARVTVIEPATGVEIDVDADSPQAKAWGKPTKKAAPKATKTDTTQD